MQRDGRVAAVTKQPVFTLVRQRLGFSGAFVTVVMSDFMNLVTGLGKEQDSHVMDTVTDRIAYIGDYLVPSDRAQFQTWVRNLLNPQAKELGWNTSTGESDERRQLRKEVLYTLGYQGRDPEVLARAREEAPKVVDGTSATLHSLTPIRRSSKQPSRRPTITAISPR